MDGTGLQVQARFGVDFFGQSVEAGGFEAGARVQLSCCKFFHQVAEYGALGAAGGLRFLFQLVFVVGFAGRADDDGVYVVVVVDGGDFIVGAQHVLVEQVADGEQIGMVADGHHGHDFAGVEVERQRAFGDDDGLNGAALVIDAGHRRG